MKTYNTNNNLLKGRVINMLPIDAHMCGSRRFFFRGCPTFFIVDGGKEDANADQPTSETQIKLNSFHWRADGGPTLNAVLVAL